MRTWTVPQIGQSQQFSFLSGHWTAGVRGMYHSLAHLIPYHWSSLDSHGILQSKANSLIRVLRFKAVEIGTSLSPAKVLGIELAFSERYFSTQFGSMCIETEVLPFSVRSQRLRPLHSACGELNDPIASSHDMWTKSIRGHQCPIAIPGRTCSQSAARHSLSQVTVMKE
jgi:hypothetical protein